MSFFVPREVRNGAGGEPEGELGAKSLIQELWDWMKSLAVALLVIMILHQFGFNLSTVRGSSMEPTLHEGQWLFVNKAVAYFRAPKRGEVVILKEPIPERAVMHPYLVKRVVAVAGDQVESRNGRLLVNGKPAEEPYTDVPIRDGDFGPMAVKDGHVFVMGDNRHRAASLDSRTFGDVPVSLVQGRVEWVLWPFADAAGL